MYQTWQVVLGRIHDELGSGNTKLEITDRQIIETIRQQVMPIFSTYSSISSQFYKMTVSHIISRDPITIYQFKTDEMEYGISGVNKIIMDATQTRIDQNIVQDMYTNTGDISDYLVRQNYMQMTDMIVAPNTWKFVRPDQIHLTRGVATYNDNVEFIVEYGAVHINPDTIDSGLWQEFLDMCVAYLLIKVGKIRKKFNNVTTPFGTVELNADEMIQDGRILQQSVMDRLNRTPSSDQLVYFL